MTKEEFMKKVLGAQYSEKESGLLDKVAKKNLGAQYTEKEMEGLMGVSMNKGGTVVDPDGGYGGSPYQNTGKKTMIPFDTNVYGEPVAPVDVNALTQQFYSILGGMQNKKEQERVIQIFQMSDDNGKIDFMKYIVDNPNMATGYAVQDEGNMYTGENTPTKNFSNLGFN
jgi:hypothetical protein